MEPKAGGPEMHHVNRANQRSPHRLIRCLGLGAVFALALGSQASKGGQLQAAAFPAASAVEDFTVFRNSYPPDGGVPFSLNNLTFTDLGGNLDTNRWIVFEPGTTIQFPVGEILADNHTFSHLRVDFATPVTMAGLDVGFFGYGTYEVSFYGTSRSLLGVVTGSNVPFKSFFAGWGDAAGISHLEVLEVSGDNGFVTGIDNVRSFPAASSVPEPGTYLMLGTGLLALLGSRRRR